MRTTRLAPRLLICLLASLLFTAHAAAQAEPAAPGLAPIRQYIAAGWDNLTRSMTDCASVADPKMKVDPVLYVPAGFAVPAAVEKLHATMPVPAAACLDGNHRTRSLDPFSRGAIPCIWG
jgi:hypothetical protein